MNKVLVLVYVPLIDEEYDMFIPINQKIGKIKANMIKTINELIGSNIINTNAKIYEKNSSAPFQNDIYVKQSGIKNGDKLVLM